MATSRACGPKTGTPSNLLSVATPLLQVTDLTVGFRIDGQVRKPVQGISYSLDAGRTLGVVGESGCGKSLTALALLGLIPAPGQVTGSVRFAGAELIGQPEAAWRDLRGNRVAMVFQEPMTALNPVMPIGTQIAEVMVLHQSLAWPEARDAAIGLLEAVGISSPRQRAASYPHQLSGGMRQRAMIAMALACRPALLVADEPTTALDVTIQAQIIELMQELQSEIGMAIQFISHNLAVVSELADEIVVMYAGRIVERAPAATLFDRPAHPYTKGLIATLPDPDRRQARLPVIQGGVPRIDAFAVGCRFAERCPLADAHCRSVEPTLDPLEPEHWAACFKAGQ
ncbi:MAG: Peptide/nickel transport system ATP-binding protein [Rhodospirillales bacterium]|nr:Peptide/nickel transport system ATP-binding protein [Rhodospirillales bacterium]